MKSIVTQLWTGAALLAITATLPQFAFANGVFAVRTWVSVNGSDAEQFCTQTTPCRTFQHAIDILGAREYGLEVIALTAGDFGPISMPDGQRFITVDGGPSMATVNAFPNGPGIRFGIMNGGRFTFRNLKIKGNLDNVYSITSQGIAYRPTFEEDFAKNQYGSTEMIVENVVIEGFGYGIDVNLHSQNRVSIQDVTINHCELGISIQTSAGTISSSIRRVHIYNSAVGITVGNGTRTSVSESKIAFGAAGESNIGVLANDYGGGSVLSLESTLISYASNIGVLADGAGSVVHLSNNTIAKNTTGLGTAAGGQILSFGNNTFTGNQNDGSAATPEGLK